VKRDALNEVVQQPLAGQRPHRQVQEPSIASRAGRPRGKPLTPDEHVVERLAADIRDGRLGSRVADRYEQEPALLRRAIEDGVPESFCSVSRSCA
jgi:hypothetical protein